MTSRILVGDDGSDGSRDALALARSLALGEAAITLVAVVGDADADALAAAERRLASNARALDPEPSFRALASGSTPRALAEAAAADGASLIVIGSTHRGAVGRVLPGTVGERLLEGARCAVAVAPRGYGSRQHPGLEEIGVGYDGRAEAREALTVAVSLAARVGASLRLIAVDRTLEPHDLLPGELPPTRDELALALDRALARIGDQVEASAEIVSGPAAAALADRGVELDLLVLGSRGYGPVRRTLLGGVSGEVMRTAPCPVVVVPRSADEGEPAPD
ncbi:MAG TPA: universal stress protein [Solirubrobacterales bacterium]|nr:universal stress protein [Solirubrobacterales bacterium]